jgi:hypothetical protein
MRWLASSATWPGRNVGPTGVRAIGGAERRGALPAGGVRPQNFATERLLGPIPSPAAARSQRCVLHAGIMTISPAGL